MRKKKTKMSSLIMLLLGLTALQAQESINVTGGNAMGSGGIASYSIGQVVYTSNIGTNGMLTQGVQQVYEITVATALEDAKGIDLFVKAYPNPATNYLTLKIDKLDTSNISYQLYDMSGKLLENKKLDGNETSIVMGNRVPAIYFLKVIKENKEVKTFKIIKN